MILALDPGLQDLGWAVVTPRTGHVLELGLVHQARDEELHKSTDRAGRAHTAAAILAELARRHRCTAIAAEAMSFNPRRFTMALGLGMSWGAIAALAAALKLALYELPPKLWQHAVLGRAPGDRGKVNYDEVARRLAEFIGHVGAAAEQLAAIKATLRNHVYDAVGVGVMTAMRPEEATRIGGRGDGIRDEADGGWRGAQVNGVNPSSRERPHRYRCGPGQPACGNSPNHHCVRVPHSIGIRSS